MVLTASDVEGRMTYLKVRQGRVEPDTPVDKSFLSVDETIFVQLAEGLVDGQRVGLRFSMQPTRSAHGRKQLL